MKQRWIEGWKVLLSKDRTSFTGPYRNKPVTYHKNKIVGRPKNCGPLTVFKNERAAIDFVTIHLIKGLAHNAKIVKCLYIQSKHIKIWESEIQDSSLPLARLPYGTILAEKIKCLE